MSVKSSLIMWDECFHIIWRAPFPRLFVYSLFNVPRSHDCSAGSMHFVPRIATSFGCTDTMWTMPNALPKA